MGRRRDRVAEGQLSLESLWGASDEETADVTEGSFDGYSWQTVARKTEFIAQAMRGTLDVREIEDIGDSALSYNEVKALATGNPLLLDHVEAKADVTDSNGSNAPTTASITPSGKPNRPSPEWRPAETSSRLRSRPGRTPVATPSR